MVCSIWRMNILRYKNGGCGSRTSVFELAAFLIGVALKVNHKAHRSPLFAFLYFLHTHFHSLTGGTTILVARNLLRFVLAIHSGHVSRWKRAQNVFSFGFLILHSGPGGNPWI